MSRRTTITLDSDLADLLEAEARRTGESLRQTINRVLRLGLHPPSPGRPTRFRVRARKLGNPHGLSFDNIEELLDQIERPWRR